MNQSIKKYIQQAQRNLNLVGWLILGLCVLNIGLLFNFQNILNYSSLWNEVVFENKRLLFFGYALSIVIILLFFFTAMYFFNLSRFTNRLFHTFNDGFKACQEYAEGCSTGTNEIVFNYTKDDEFLELGKTLLRIKVSQEQRVKELAVKEEELKNLSLLLDRFTSISITDPDGTILKVNKKFCEISGYSEQEILGKNHRILNSGVHPKSYFEIMWNTITSGKIWTNRICNKNKDGSKYWSMASIMPIYSGSKIIQFIALRFDISEQVNNEQQLEQMSKLSAVGEMAGSIAHEINSPLAALQLIVEGHIDSNPNPLCVEDGQAMLRAVHRITNIVKSVLSMSRHVANRDPVSSVSLAEVVSESLEVLQGRCVQENIQLQIDLSSSCNLMSKPTELSQVLVNLVSNSINAVRKFSNREKWISINTDYDDSWGYIHVVDSGDGIEPEIAEKITQPFFSTGQTGESLGIGLNISMRIMKDLGGGVYYKDDERNTHFVIQIPRTFVV